MWGCLRGSGNEVQQKHLLALRRQAYLRLLNVPRGQIARRENGTVRGVQGGGARMNLETQKKVERVVREVFAEAVRAEKCGEAEGIYTERDSRKVSRRLKSSKTALRWAANKYLELLLGDLARFGKFQDHDYCQSADRDEEVGS
jgi:hypothetical protein